MNDPYAVLGVNKNATDAEIKVAYREMIKKYHPDRYANNPLADLANEKIQEVNKAYEQINNMRSGKQTETQAESQNNNYNQYNNPFNNPNNYQNQRYYRNSGGGGCDFCTSLICADCLCECLGGDLISCC